MSESDGNCRSISSGIFDCCGVGGILGGMFDVDQIVDLIEFLERRLKAGAFGVLLLTQVTIESFW